MEPRPQAITTIKVEEPHVRVTEYRFSPGAETGWHVHGHDYVIVPMVDGTLLIEAPGGASITVPLSKEAPYARLAGVEHNVVNAGVDPITFLEIEILR